MGAFSGTPHLCIASRELFSTTGHVLFAIYIDTKAKATSNKNVHNTPTPETSSVFHAFSHGMTNFVQSVSFKTTQIKAYD